MYECTGVMGVCGTDGCLCYVAGVVGVCGTGGCMCYVAGVVGVCGAGGCMCYVAGVWVHVLCGWSDGCMWD